jgi:hypothetical protein
MMNPETTFLFCSADWQSAVSQIGNLRHGRLPVCATGGLTQ